MSNIQEEGFQPQLPNQPQSIPQNKPENVQKDSPSPELPTPFEFINKINQNENSIENPKVESNSNNINLPSQNLINPNDFNSNVINIVKTSNNNAKTNANNSNNKNDEIVKEPNKTKLENRFSFWYRIDTIIQNQLQKQTLNKNEYENQVKKIAEFGTVEDFWGIFQHLRKPDSCKAGIEYFMFKEPIKPMWEDENNKNGGRISIKLRKAFTTIIWEEMIFILIGGILPKEMKDEINGIVVTSRKEYNTLQIWFKNYDTNLIKDLEQCIRDILVIPPEVNLEIKQFYKNNKKEYNNDNNNSSNNNKKSGGYYNNKGYNNYYNDGEYEYEYYNNDRNDYKKNKHQNHKNNK
jgi:translation initiation factor 4E